MADKVYQLPYDEEIDKDISDWLNSLPRARKAELVRNAIRFYLQATQGESIITVNTTPVSHEVQDKQEKPIEKKERSKMLPTDGNF